MPGISKPTYTPEEIKEFNRKENEPVEYNGKTYTKYEATQRQRKLETTMRAQRQEIRLLKEGGANEDDLIAARARYRGTSAEYARFSKAMDLPQQRERVTVDGLGNIGQGKYTGGSGKASPVQAPPVGSKVTDKVTAEERRELLLRNPVDISEKSGIIKSIDVDDYKLVVSGKEIVPEVNEVILNTMKRCEKDGGFVISEISDKISPSSTEGTPVLQIEPMSNGLLKLNVNTEFLSGKTLTQINKIFANTERNLAESLEEAIIHESGHAILIKGKNPSQIKALYTKLKGLGKSGVSNIALEDGVECLAELEVLRHRKTVISKELSDFYEKYMGRKYL